MKAILSADNNWGIGKDGELLVRLSGDMKYFREKTLGKIVVMGRATMDSLPGGKPLPGRTNIVLSRDPSYEAQCQACASKEELIQLCGVSEDVFVIGGAQIYQALLPYCDTVYVTKIDAALPADRHFPNLDADIEWKLESESDPIEENGIRYRFTEYRRREG